MAVRKIGKCWWVDIRLNHIRYRKKSPLNTKGGAEAYEITLRARVARNEPIDPPQVIPEQTFAKFSRTWLETYAKTNNKPSECRTKHGVVERHLIPFFGRMKLSEIKTLDVESYKVQKTTESLCAKTINNHLVILGKCLRTAEEWEQCKHLPRIRPLRAQPPAFDFLSPDESDQLLSSEEEPMWRGMALVALRTGLRLGELFALERKDVDFQQKMLTVSKSIVRGILGTPKNHRVRHIPLANDALEFFQGQGRNGLIFSREDGRPLTDSMAEKAIKRLCKRVGLRNIGWHVLRHSFASLANDLGYSDATVGALEAMG